jgi:hypothetical protein
MDQTELTKWTERAKQWTPRTHLSKAAADLQRLVRMERAAFSYGEIVVVGGKLEPVLTPGGHCVCVTCGFVAPWKRLQGGHFLQSRRPSIVLEEAGVNPQCVECNLKFGGRPEAYEKYMEHHHGRRKIEWLIERKHNMPKSWTHEELAAKRIEYRDRRKAAMEAME